MPRSLSSLIALFAVVYIAFQMLAIFSGHSPANSAATPANSYVDANGREVSLSDYLGNYLWVDYAAEWCSYCAKMERETFSDRRVAAFLNEAFVPIRVDYDRENRVVEEFNVRKIPATWFVDEKGERISNLPGFVPAEMFLNILRYVESDRYKTVPFSEYIRSL